MKKNLTIIFIVLSALLILDSMNAFHALTMFMLAGIIPGTNIVINADRMLEFFTFFLGFVLARVSVRLGQAFSSYMASRPVKSRA